MCIGSAILAVVLNLFEPAPGIVMASLIVYLGGGGFLMGRYCALHEDELPPLPPRDTRRP
jgi:hypothetical protein